MYIWDSTQDFNSSRGFGVNTFGLMYLQGWCHHPAHQRTNFTIISPEMLMTRPMSKNWSVVFLGASSKSSRDPWNFFKIAPSTAETEKLFIHLGSRAGLLTCCHGLPLQMAGALPVAFDSLQGGRGIEAAAAWSARVDLETRRLQAKKSWDRCAPKTLAGAWGCSRFSGCRVQTCFSARPAGCIAQGCTNLARTISQHIFNLIQPGSTIHRSFSLNFSAPSQPRRCGSAWIPCQGGFRHVEWKNPKRSNAGGYANRTRDGEGNRAGWWRGIWAFHQGWCGMQLDAYRIPLFCHGHAPARHWRTFYHILPFFPFFPHSIVFLCISWCF